MAGRFCGKVAVVTGGSSGIGKGIVTRLVHEGCNVFFCSFNEEEGYALEKSLRDQQSGSGSAKFISFSASDEDSIKHVIKTAVEAFGRLDYLINNVGQHPPPLSIEKTETGLFKQLLDINVMSYFLMSKYAISHLRETKGCIVNVASMVASIGQKSGIAYCATKGAVVAMTKAMAIDEAPNGVRINSISPGNIWTPMWESVARLHPEPEQLIAESGKHQLLGRFGTPDECAGACIFLLSDDAAFLTGVDLPVSGGAELDYGVKASS